MVARESQNPHESHHLKLAEHFDIKDGTAIIHEVRNAIGQWSNIAGDLDISPGTIKNIQEALNGIGK